MEGILRKCRLGGVLLRQLKNSSLAKKTAAEKGPDSADVREFTTGAEQPEDIFERVFRANDKKPMTCAEFKINPTKKYAECVMKTQP